MVQAVYKWDIAYSPRQPLRSRSLSSRWHIDKHLHVRWPESHSTRESDTIWRHVDLDNPVIHLD